MVCLGGWGVGVGGLFCRLSYRGQGYRLTVLQASDLNGSRADRSTKPFSLHLSMRIL